MPTGSRNIPPDLTDEQTMSAFSPPSGHGGPADGDANTPPGSPLDAQHYQALRQAKVRRAKLDRAAAVAAFNGWSLAIFAALSLPFALFSLKGLVVCLGLGAVAYHEFKGRRMLHQLDPRGPRLLGINQLALGVLIVGYCAWSLLTAFTGPSPYAEYIQAEPALRQTLGSVDELYRLGAVAIYGGVILLILPYQGLMAWYHFSRAKHLHAYLDQTPDWVTEMQRATA